MEKKTMRVVLGLLCMLFAAARLEGRHERVGELSWMTGCWVEDLGVLTIVDEWSAPSGHTMRGVSRIRRGDSTVAVEVLTVSEAGGAFMMTTAGRASRDTVRFSRDGARLELWRERLIGDHERKLDELFERAACEGGVSKKVASAETLQ